MADDKFPLSKPAIWAMCVLLTPLCGAVLYYAWRNEHPAAARYANHVSWFSFLVWTAFVVWQRL